jgi:hypothetical protein
MKRSTAEIAAEIAAALVKGPRTAKQLCEMVGVDDSHACDVLKYVDQFKASGLVHVQGWSKYRRPIYAWCNVPFEKPDVPPPPSDSPHVGLRRSFEYEGERKTLAQLAAMAGCGVTTMQRRIDRALTPEQAVAMGPASKCKKNRPTPAYAEATPA